MTRDLEPGPHRIRVSNTLVWKTVHFTVKPGEQVFFEAINRPGWGSLPMLLVLGVGPLFVDAAADGLTRRPPIASPAI